MPADLIRAALLLVCVFSQTAPPASPPAEESIADALCGRGKGTPVTLAAALDGLDPSAVPASWRRLDAATVGQWRLAATCADPSPDEDDRVQARRKALIALQARLDRSRVIAEIGSALGTYRGLQFVDKEWPAAAECPACSSLRSTAEEVAAIAARVPARAKTDARTIEAVLDVGDGLEPLVRELCALKPRHGDVSVVSAKYRYYTWTRTGAKILAVAEFVNQSTLAPVCREP
jgi:hypothetical protein